ncbi:MAG: sulfotransferase domain-containing protein [Pirellulaceae bacterium]|nr:sulfotransferase domain-containing protein [Pirellulaceae bacterium]
MRRQIRRTWASLRGPRVLANSFPKSGTHLLLRCLSLLPWLVPQWHHHLDHGTPDYESRIRRIRRGQYLSSHLAWSGHLAGALSESRVRSLLMVRDLRDVAVSNAFYIANPKHRHRLQDYFRSLPSDGERLLASIAGVPAEQLPDGVASLPLGTHAAAYLPWLDDPHCLIVRFEDLVGGAGGGSDMAQRETIQRIADHLGIPLSAARRDAIARCVFDRGARTFRQGRIGDWRHHFDGRHREAFEQTAGQLLSRFGYAADAVKNS